jgi:hypothetical protein
VCMRLEEYRALQAKEKKPRKYNLVELREQISLIKQAYLHPLIKKHLIAIPNGGTRDKISAKLLQSQGVKAGVSDLFFAYPCKGYAGLWIELKRPAANESSLSDDQKDWLRTMIHAGYMGKVAMGAEHAWKIIQDYLDGKCEYDEWYSFKSKNMMIANGEGKQ